MAFLLHNVTTDPAWVYLPTTAATYQTGDACVLSSGVIVAVSSGVGQDTDEGTHYICMLEGTVAVTGDLAPFVKSTNTIIWQTILSADDSDLAIGTTYTIYTDGRKFDHTTTKGCFTVTGYDGLTAGDYVYGTLV